MEYKNVVEIAQLWGISERTVCNYCAEGRIDGAKLIGKTWNIPADAIRPSRRKLKNSDTLLHILREQKKAIFTTIKTIMNGYTFGINSRYGGYGLTTPQTDDVNGVNFIY
jgi:hypothetical protein